MAKKTEAQIEFTARTDSFNEGIKKMNAGIKTLSKELKLNETQMKGVGETTGLLEQKQKILAQQYEASKTKVELAKKSLEEAKTVLGENSKEYQIYNNKLIDAQTEEQKLKNALNAATNQLEEHEQTLKKEISVEEKFEKATAGMNKGIEEADLALQGFSKELKLNEQGMQRNGESAKGLKEKQRLLQEAYDMSRAKVILAEQSLEEAEKVFGKNSSEAQKMKNALLDAKIEERELKSKLDDTTKSIKEQYSASAYIAKGFDAVGKGVQAVGDFVQAAGEKISSAGKKLQPLSTAVTGLGIAGFKMAMDFDDGMANINTLLDDESHLEGYKNAVKNLSNDTGMNIKIVQDGMYQAISSIGDGGAETEKIFGTMTKSAKAGGAEVADAVSLISAGMKGYNSVSNETAQKISDLAFETAKLGVTTFPEMAKSMQPLFPLSSSLNMSMEELFGVMATGTGVTGNTAEVSTQLKAVMSNLMKPTKSMQELMEKYGYQNAQTMMETEGLSGVLRILKDETGGQSDKMAQLFSSTEALTLMTSLTGSQFDTFGQKLEAVGGCTGSTESALAKVETRGDTLRKTFNEAKNTLMEAGSVMLQSAGPAINEIAGKVHQLAEGFSKLNPEQQKTILIIAGAVAVAAPVLGIVGSIVSGIGSVISVVGTLISGIGALIPVITAISPSMIAVVGAIVGVIGIGVALYKNWDTIKEKAGQLKEAVVQKVTALKDGATQKFTEMREKVSQTVENLKTGAVAKFEGIRSAVTSKVDAAKAAVTEKFSAIRTNMTNAMEQAKSSVSGKLENIKNAYNNAGGGIKGIVTGCMTGVKEIFKTGMEAADAITGGKLSAIQGYFSGKLSSAYSSASATMSRIKDAFSTKIDEAREKVSGGIEKIKGFFNFSWSLPKLKLPHFSITGKFGIDPPSVPKFGINWYAKGGLFTGPTVIPANGFGEAGHEYALPLNRTTLAPLAQMLGSMIMAEREPIDYKRIDKIIEKYSKKEYVFRIGRRELMRAIEGR